MRWCLDEARVLTLEKIADCSAVVCYSRGVPSEADVTAVLQIGELWWVFSECQELKRSGPLNPNKAHCPWWV